MDQQHQDLHQDLKSLILKGIDLHLKSTIQYVNIRGMVVAELFSKFMQSETPLKFDYSLDTPDQDSFSLDFSIDHLFKEITPGKSGNTLNPSSLGDSENYDTANQLQIEKENYRKQLENEFKKYDVDPDELMINKNNDDEDFNDLEDDLSNTNNNDIDEDYLEPYDLNDDEEDLKPERKKLYLRDCILELQSKKHTAESWEGTLTSISNIVWNKPDDLDELSEGLTKSLLHLTNEYGLDNFTIIRHEAMVSLVVQSPTVVVPFLTKSFYEPNYSLSQRLEILEVLSEGAKVLSADNNQQQKQQQQQQQQNKLESLSTINSLLNINQQQEIKSIGKTRKWGIPTQPRPVIKSNQFHKYSTLFFYPLLSKYDKVTQCYSMDLMGYDTYLLCKLIYTLGIFVECSSSANETRSMARELVSLLWSLRFHNDTNVRRSILFSLSRVFLTLPSSIIKTDYIDELNELMSWLYDISQSDPDKDCRVMAIDDLSNINLNENGEQVFSVDYSEFQKQFVGDPQLLEITGLPTFIEVLLNTIHTHTNLSWMVIVPLFTLAVRSALLPFAIKLRVNSARLMEIKPKLDAFKAKQQENRAKGISNYENSVQITNLLKEKKCHPLLTYVLPLVNFPFFISSIIAFREMAATFPSLKTAGAFWFTDLGAADPYYVFPVVCSALYLLVNELSIGKADSLLIKCVSWAVRFMSLLIIPLGHTIPMMVFLYWIPSSLFTITQIQAFKSPKVCKFLNIPMAKLSDIITQQQQQQPTKPTNIRIAPERKKRH
eukprot:gene5229-6510_t